MRDRRTGILCLCFFLVGFLVYGASLHNGFVVWDDDTLVYQNPLVLNFSWHSLKGIFTSYDPELYIPLTLFTYQIEHLFFGLNPLPYHLTSLLLHTLNALLVLQLLRKLGASDLASTVCGLIFLVHPLNTEAVSWVSGRKDLLCSTFILASLLAYLRYREHESRTWLIRSLIFALLAMLSKATAVILPAVLILLDNYQKNFACSQYLRTWRARCAELFPFVVLSTIFFVIGLFGKTENVTFITPLQTLLLSAKSSIFALMQFLWPFNLSSIYQQTTPIVITSAEFFIPLSIFLGISTGAIFFVRRFPSLLFSWTWFLLFLLPSFANFAKEGDVYFAGDRYPYLAQIGVLFLIAIVIDLIVRRSTQGKIDVRAVSAVIGVPFVLLASVLSYQSHARSLIWGDSETLFRDALTKNERSWEMHYHLGLLAHRRKEYVEAESEYQRAVELFPLATVARVNLGMLLLETHRSADGEALLHLVAETDAHDASALNALGALQMNRGEIEEAIISLEEAIRRDPSFAQSYVNLGHAYGKKERYEDAIKVFREASRRGGADIPEELLKKMESAGF